MNSKIKRLLSLALVATALPLAVFVVAKANTRVAKADAAECSLYLYDGVWRVYVGGNLYAHASEGENLEAKAKLSHIANDLAEAGICRF